MFPKKKGQRKGGMQNLVLKFICSKKSLLLFFRFRMVIWFLAPLILLIIGAVIAAVTIPLVLAQKKATTPIPS
jgi:hypothetical protein